MTQFIYQSPKKGHLRSSPVDADDTARRRILEKAGWVIVETIPDPAPPTPVEGSVQDAGGETGGEAETGEAQAAADALSALLGDRLAATRLVEAGYPTAAALNEATDEELEAIDGIGPATVLKIRNALASAIAFGDGEDAEDEE